MSRPELFISIDIETNGPAPGVNSMLALGAAAFKHDGTPAFTPDGSGPETWYATLHPLAGTSENPETMDWWKGQPDAWAEVNRDRQQPRYAIPGFVRWCETLRDDTHAKLVAVAWPAAFDFAFVNYYCHRFAGRNPLGFACLDIRSYANALIHHPGYYETPEQAVRDLAGEIDKTGLRPHVAVDDAIEQGRLFAALLKVAG